jgi:hypothetical protein
MWEMFIELLRLALIMGYQIPFLFLEGGNNLVHKRIIVSIKPT